MEVEGGGGGWRGGRGGRGSRKQHYMYGAKVRHG